MESKKRITIKQVSEDFNKELENIKETMKTLEIRLEASEKKVKSLEVELNTKNEDIEKNVKECFKCKNRYTNESDLKEHIQSMHAKIYGCTVCEKKFVKRFEFEIHMRDHENIQTFVCTFCEKNFVLEWRLRKHEEGHRSESKKFCHYFNNCKFCPYEEIGCKFKHKPSPSCRFEKHCHFKLCQFTHMKDGNEQVDVEQEVEENLVKQFENISDMERFEAKEVLCDNYCRASYGYHRCSDINQEGFIGCDVMNITDDYENEDENGEGVVTVFPCEQCDEKFDEFDKFSKHFETNHKPEEFVKCFLEQCDFKAKTVNYLKMHIGVDHLELVRRRL